MAKKSKQYDYDLGEVKRLIGETDKNYREIAAETGCPYASVVYHGRKIRGRVNRMRQEEIQAEQQQPQSLLALAQETPGGTNRVVWRDNIKYIQERNPYPECRTGGSEDD